ncbi:rRNA processing/ribosome biogenesis-domain-containing protein [Xylariales sp. PMI_506]|nr:rRNA processing/ribosome biogenesis-domain-containing protein [Xylariales sp. PMI_506]
MALASPPPELRSLCRKLTSAKPEQLPNLLPVLLRDVQRCQVPLSSAQESKTTANSSEVVVLVHKLRTQITALLSGRSVEGRFAAIPLVKTFIEVGGWECLRLSEPWVRGLLSILQKRDPIVTKEFAVVTLTKIYLLVSKYQTLIRELATPTIPTFATSCLQLLKQSGTGKGASIPLSFIETISEALSTLIPLYPTTLRPFGAQIRSAARAYLAPTSSDVTIVPNSLQASSRRLVVRLHMTAAKNGGSDEWSKHITGLIKDFHESADQVFRAVQESWESTTGFVRQPVDIDTDPTGGGSSADQLPEWVGIQAGSERMVGLLHYIAESFRCATKVSVTVPVSAITELVTRVSSIAYPVPGKDKSESVQLNPAVGREEKEDLWAVFPEVQVATLQLILAVARRLGRNYLPLAQETLDQIVRIFESSYRLPECRSTAFALVSEMLHFCGPTMSKSRVDALNLIVKACCRDMLGAAGHIRVSKPQAMAQSNSKGAKSVTQNADAFLSAHSEEESISVTLDEQHLRRAEQLLVTLFSHLPQRHINSSLRSRMLRTAILCRSRDAQVASVLHPSRDRSGRIPKVILPYLHQQFPQDESVEILRFNFRPMATSTKGDFLDIDHDAEMGEEESPEKPYNEAAFTKPFEVTFTDNHKVASLETTQPAELVPVTAVLTADVQPSPFLPAPVTGPADVVQEPVANGNPLKRKNDDAAPVAAKRVGVESAVAVTSELDPGFGSVGELVQCSLEMIPTVSGNTVDGDADDDDDDDDDESVHLNMDLDSDGDGDGEEDEES